MEDRKKAGPFLPKWLKVKSRHKALNSGNLFKPDITGAINRYDQTLKDYDDLVKEQEKLKDIIRELGNQGSEAAAKRDQVVNDLAKLDKTFGDRMKQSSQQMANSAGGSNADPAKVVEILTDIVDTVESFFNERKGQWQKLESGGIEHLQRFKKARDEYKKIADASAAEMKKLEDLAYKCQSEIGEILVDYVNIADDADHPEIIKDIKTLRCV